MANNNEKTKFHFGRNPLSILIVLGGIFIVVFAILIFNGWNNISKHKVTAFVDGSPNTTSSSVDYSNYGLFKDIEYIDQANYSTFDVTLKCTDWNRASDKASFSVVIEMAGTTPQLYTTSLDTSYTMIIELCVASKINTYTAYSPIKKIKVSNDYNNGKTTTTTYINGIDIYPRSVYEFPFFYISESEPTVYLNIFYYTNTNTYHNDCLVYDYKDFEVQSGGIAK